MGETTIKFAFKHCDKWALGSALTIWLLNLEINMKIVVGNGRLSKFDE